MGWTDDAPRRSRRQGDQRTSRPAQEPPDPAGRAHRCPRGVAGRAPGLLDRRARGRPPARRCRAPRSDPVTESTDRPSRRSLRGVGRIPGAAGGGWWPPPAVSAGTRNDCRGRTAGARGHRDLRGDAGAGRRHGARDRGGRQVSESRGAPGGTGRALAPGGAGAPRHPSPRGDRRCRLARGSARDARARGPCPLAGRGAGAVDDAAGTGAGFVDDARVRTRAGCLAAGGGCARPAPCGGGVSPVAGCMGRGRSCAGPLAAGCDSVGRDRRRRRDAPVAGDLVAPTQ